MAFSRKMIVDEKLVTGRDATGGLQQIGRLDPARFTTQIKQMEDLDMLPKGKLTAATVMTIEYLPYIEYHPG